MIDGTKLWLVSGQQTGCERQRWMARTRKQRLAVLKGSASQNREGVTWIGVSAAKGLMVRTRSSLGAPGTEGPDFVRGFLSSSGLCGQRRVADEGER
jgi:hypothetical protein